MAKPAGMMIAIGIPKSRRGGPEPEAPEPIEESGRKPMPKPPMEREEPEQRGGGGSLTPEDVGYIYPDQHCSGCEHHGEDGQCRKYGFQCEPEGGCLFGFSPRMDEEPQEGMEEEQEMA